MMYVRILKVFVLLLECSVRQYYVSVFVELRASVGHSSSVASDYTQSTGQ